MIISFSIDRGSLITTKHWNQLRRRRWYIFRRRRWMDLLRSDIDLLRSTSDMNRSTQIWLDIRLSPSISFFFSLSAIHFCFSVLMEKIFEFWTSSFRVLVTGSENFKILQFQIFFWCWNESWFKTVKFCSFITFFRTVKFYCFITCFLIFFFS